METRERVEADLEREVAKEQGVSEKEIVQDSLNKLENKYKKGTLEAEFEEIRQKRQIERESSRREAHKRFEEIVSKVEKVLGSGEEREERK